MNLEKSWALQIDPTIYKFLNKIPRKDSERILFVLEKLTQDPFLGDIEKMSGEINIWRKRIGAYRLFYEIHKNRRIIYIFKLERRTSTTY